MNYNQQEDINPNMTIHILQLNQHYIDPLNSINIITYNVQGLNNLLKLQTFLEFCNNNSYHLISMTETKIAEFNNSHYQLSNLYYQIYISNCNLEIAKKQESSMGIAIAVYKLLQPYIHNIQTEAGTAININFFFP